MVSMLPKFDRPVTAPEPPVAEHLATVAAEIADEFPLVLDHTSLVLLDLDPGHLHAFWTLAPEDRHRAGAAFRAGDATPELVIQLRRLHLDGGVEVLARLPMAEGPRGDARFDMDNDDATYQAEIGLSTSDGGWLLLARSNQARLPRQVGVPIPVWDGQERPQAESGASAQAQDVSVSHDFALAPSVVQTAGEPSAYGLGRVPQPRVQSQHQPQTPVPLQPPESGTRPARWVLAAASGALTPEAFGEAQVGPEGVGTWADPGEALHPDSGPAPGPAAGSAAIPLGPEGHESLLPSQPGEPQLGQVSRPEPSPMARPEPPGPISSFAVGGGPGAPVIEAEVLVHISAMPGTLVDIYGRPVRVGPSGRATLRLPVSDLTLLTELLDPPAGHEEGTGNP